MCVFFGVTMGERERNVEEKEEKKKYDEEEEKETNKMKYYA